MEIEPVHSNMLLPILLLLGFPLGGVTQESVHIRVDAQCDCSLRTELVTTLADEDGRAGLSRPLVVEQTPGGDYLVVPSSRQGAVLLFDAAGRFVRQIGSPGQGPGEFGAVIGIQPGPADSMLAMDAGNARLTVIGPDLSVARTVRLPAFASSWFGMSEEGNLVIMMPIPRASRGERVRVFDRQMNQVRSFMPGDALLPGRSVESLRRRLAVSAKGVIAVAHNDRYVIELWSESGELLRVLTRTPDWMPSAPTDATGSQQRLSGRVETPRIDDSGQVWTVTHVPTSDGGQGVSSGVHDGTMNSVIELLDPVAGLLLGSVRVDARVNFVSNDGLAVSYRETDSGMPYVDVWQFTRSDGAEEDDHLGSRHTPHNNR